MLICRQLDSITVGEWQLRKNNKKMPNHYQVESFQSKRVSAYGPSLVSNKPAEENSNHSRNNIINSKALFVRTSITNKCLVCADLHKVYGCEKFKNMSIKEWINVVNRSGFCFNCLNFNHQVKSCRYLACPWCGNNQNFNLHEDVTIRLQFPPVDGTINSEQPNSSQVLYFETAKSQHAKTRHQMKLHLILLDVHGPFLPMLGI